MKNIYMYIKYMGNTLAAQIISFIVFWGLIAGTMTFFLRVIKKALLDGVTKAADEFKSIREGVPLAYTQKDTHKMFVDPFLSELNRK